MDIVFATEENEVRLVCRLVSFFLGSELGIGPRAIHPRKVKNFHITFFHNFETTSGIVFDIFEAEIKPLLMASKRLSTTSRLGLERLDSLVGFTSKMRPESS
jgi:hypothetical protein